MSSLYTGFCNYSTLLPSRPYKEISDYFTFMFCYISFEKRTSSKCDNLLSNCTYYRKPAALLYQQNNMETARFSIRKQQDLSVLDSICNIKKQFMEYEASVGWIIEIQNRHPSNSKTNSWRELSLLIRKSTCTYYFKHEWRMAWTYTLF